MNRIILGCILGILLVTGMVVMAAQEREAPAKRIGSDVFFGQDPKVIRQKITEPPPKPPMIENNGKEAVQRVDKKGTKIDRTKGKATKPGAPQELQLPSETEPGNILKENVPPVDQQMMPQTTPQSPEVAPPTEQQKQSEDYFRGY